MSTPKKPADIAPRLLEWQRIYGQWQAQYEAPIALAVGQMWDAYTAAVAREVGDENDWLEWYCWENDMGAKGLEVTSTSGEPIKVKTVAHLARVICY
jgi:hypothetical protein